MLFSVYAFFVFFSFFYILAWVAVAKKGWAEGEGRHTLVSPQSPSLFPFLLRQFDVCHVGFTEILLSFMML